MDLNYIFSPIISDFEQFDRTQYHIQPFTSWSKGAMLVPAAHGLSIPGKEVSNSPSVHQSEAAGPVYSTLPSMDRLKRIMII